MVEKVSRGEPHFFLGKGFVCGGRRPGDDGGVPSAFCRQIRAFDTQEAAIRDLAMIRVWWLSVAVGLIGLVAANGQSQETGITRSVSGSAAPRNDTSTVQRVARLMASTPIDWPRALSRDTRVSRAAYGEGASPDNQTARPVLTETVQAEDVETRLSALEGLAQTAPAENIDAFVAALSDGAPHVRDTAARILSRLNPASVFERIMFVLCGNDGAAASGEAASGEAASRMYSVLPLLKESLDAGMIHVLESGAETPLRKQVAAYCLGRMNSTAGIPALAAMTWNGDADLALSCMDALVAIRDPVILRRLAELAGHPLPQVRTLALQGIADVGGPEAIATLNRLALDPPQADEALASQAVSLLGSTKDLNVVPLLIEIMRRHLPVRRAAVEALRQITGEDLGDRPSDWQEWFQNKQRAMSSPTPEEMAAPPWEMEYLPE